MRSVHTLASVHAHLGVTSLPCLACFGTPGSLICSCVSFTLPLSCPLGSTVVSRFIATTGTLTPALLFRAPGQVSLVHRTCTSRHSVSNHPCAPVFRPYFLLRAGLASDSLLLAIAGSSDFVHC